MEKFSQLADENGHVLLPGATLSVIIERKPQYESGKDIYLSL